MTTRKELVEALRVRYQDAVAGDKVKILDEFLALTGYHRKHAIRILREKVTSKEKRARDRLYDEAVGQALTVLWEAADRVCGKRLKALCVFRTIVTDRFGIVTAEFGNVTGDFGDVTDRVFKAVRGRFPTCQEVGAGVAYEPPLGHSLTAFLAGEPMPQQRMDIRMIKDILRLKYQGGLSHERIARSLSISKGVVAKYLGLAGAAGLDWQVVDPLDEATLERRLLGRSAADDRLVEADFAQVHIELRRKGMTLMLLWQEYRAAHAGRRTWGYTQFCEHYKSFAKSLKRSMRQHRRAGEKLFIDYAGPTLALADGTCAQIFVAAMGASSYTFACATVDQSMRSWLGALARALTFYGGCPQLIVPDNARSLVSEACRYEPKLNATVREFGRHYDVSFLPARPYSPKDKASAESAVQVVTRWILARLRHTVLADVQAADAAIAALLASLNDRRFQKIDGSRASLFAAIDAPALGALPAQRWQWVTFKTVKAHIDYHVEVDAHRYSVPHALVGVELEARLTDALVEVLHRGQRVACHARSARRGSFTTLDEHMPAAHRAHKQWTPERLIHWGGEIGPAAGAFVTQLLQRFRHPEHGYRSCLGLLSLAKRYGPARLEAACLLALELGAGQYRHVRDILNNGRDLVARPVVEPEWVAPPHDNLRGAAHYH